jgi:phage tail-like protein
MPEATVQTNPLRPYLNHKFQIVMDGKCVAGVSKITGLTRKTNPIKFRDGGSKSHSLVSPGLTEYDPITLERGVTQDFEFEKWANKVWSLPNAGPKESSLKDFRKDIIIELHNEAGQKVLAYKVYRCWVSEYTALPDLDASANTVAIQKIKLENEGWERDDQVKEPDPPSF